MIVRHVFDMTPELRQYMERISFSARQMVLGGRLNQYAQTYIFPEGTIQYNFFGNNFGGVEKFIGFGTAGTAGTTVSERHYLYVKIGNQCIVWDADTAAMATDVTLNAGGYATFPCDPDTISDWLDKYSTENGNETGSVNIGFGPTGTTDDWVYSLSGSPRVIYYSNSPLSPTSQAQTYCLDIPSGNDTVIVNEDLTYYGFYTNVGESSTHVLDFNDYEYIIKSLFTSYYQDVDKLSALQTMFSTSAWFRVQHDYVRVAGDITGLDEWIDAVNDEETLGTLSLIHI